MGRPDTSVIMNTVDQLIAYRDELLSRGVPAGDVLVICGCAIGVQIGGTRP